MIRQKEGAFIMRQSFKQANMSYSSLLLPSSVSEAMHLARQASSNLPAIFETRQLDKPARENMPRP
ncbi:hypothetical protein [Paenibacillus gallinarum]|uniref:Uncharacterized protein n=2 Tax=Paenibacillus TaxID=44249 RepID=A0ABR8SVD4_9BACL|nr:hypothetical protein [Paenibacillus gallinarum]MBD7967422.1 hypothetical protein [Paenibacillus gallinarum]